MAERDTQAPTGRFTEGSHENVGSETGAKWVGARRRQGVGRESRGSGVSDSQVRMKFHAVWGEVT